MELCFNDVLACLPFERTIVVGEIASSPDFSKLDISIVHPVRILYWMESDFGRMLRQEIHFGGVGKCEFVVYEIQNPTQFSEIITFTKLTNRDSRGIYTGRPNCVLKSSYLCAALYMWQIFTVVAEANEIVLLHVNSKFLLETPSVLRYSF